MPFDSLPPVLLLLSHLLPLVTADHLFSRSSFEAQLTYITTLAPGAQHGDLRFLYMTKLYVYIFLLVWNERFLITITIWVPNCPSEMFYHKHSYYQTTKVLDFSLFRRLFKRIDIITLRFENLDLFYLIIESKMFRTVTKVSTTVTKVSTTVVVNRGLFVVCLT